MTKIAVISDIHSNLDAFKVVLKEIRQLGINDIYCCGDIVGYGAEPNECVELVRKNEIISVKGNHDISCVNLQDKELFNQFGRVAIEWSSKKLTEENKQFLFNLPKHLKLKKIYLVHGSPINPIWEYVLPDASKSYLKRLIKETKQDIDVLIMGHTHIPFIKEIKDKLIINPGAVGQPRDNNPKASFCILDAKTKKTEIKRVEYNIKKTAEKIKKAGLPEFLAERLFKGI